MWLNNCLPIPHYSRNFALKLKNLGHIFQYSRMHHCSAPRNIKLFNFLVQHQKAIHRGWVTYDCVWLKMLNLALLGGNPEMLFSIESLFFFIFSFSFLEFLFMFYREMFLYRFGDMPSSFYFTLPLAYMLIAVPKVLFTPHLVHFQC